MPVKIIKTYITRQSSKHLTVIFYSYQLADDINYYCKNNMNFHDLFV